MSQIDEIEARLKTATTGPWEAFSNGIQSDYGVQNANKVPFIEGGLYLDDAEFIAHAPADIEYLLVLVRQQMKTRTEIIAETLLAYAELLEGPTYTMDHGSADLMLKQIVHLLRRDSEDFEPRNWPARG